MFYVSLVSRPAIIVPKTFATILFLNFLNILLLFPRTLLLFSYLITVKFCVEFMFGYFCGRVETVKIKTVKFYVIANS